MSRKSLENEIKAHGKFGWNESWIDIADPSIRRIWHSWNHMWIFKWWFTHFTMFRRKSLRDKPKNSICIIITKSTVLSKPTYELRIWMSSNYNKHQFCDFKWFSTTFIFNLYFARIEWCKRHVHLINRYFNALLLKPKPHILAIGQMYYYTHCWTQWEPYTRHVENVFFAWKVRY